MLGAQPPHSLASPTYAAIVSGVTAALICVLLTLPTATQAGTYKMYTCNVPGRAVPVPSVGPWTWALDGRNTTIFDNCATGGTFGIGLNPGTRSMRPVSSARLALRRPASGPLSRIGIVRYKTWLIAQLSGRGAPAFISDGGAFGPPGGANSDAAPWISPLFAQNNSSVSVQLFCSGGAPGDCVFNSAKPLQARGVEVDLYEEAAPTGSIDGGSMVDVGLKSGMRSVSYSAFDAESGVSRVDALLGDTVVAVHDLGSKSDLCPHVAFNACPGTRSSDFAIDTRTVADGRHSLTLRVTDAAGNRRVVPGPIVHIGNGLDVFGAHNGTNVGKHVVMSAYFETSRRAMLTTRFGKRVVVRGRLRTNSRRPIANAKIDISGRVALPDAVRRALNSTRTDAKGRFRYVMTRVSSSRLLRFTYRLRHGDLNVAASRRLTLKVRAASSLRVSLRGVRVRYEGRVRFLPVPGRGKRVLMQGRAKGSAWQTFATRRTGRRGRFSGRYRLRVRRPGVRLQFRAMVPSERGYPFAAGAGRSVTRTVR